MARNVAELHKRRLAEPGKEGQLRNDSDARAVCVVPSADPYLWNAEAYRDRWDLIAERLGE
jgi:hypothetical protein